MGAGYNETTTRIDGPVWQTFNVDSVTPARDLVQRHSYVTSYPSGEQIVRSESKSMKGRALHANVEGPIRLPMPWYPPPLSTCERGKEEPRVE